MSEFSPLEITDHGLRVTAPLTMDKAGAMLVAGQPALQGGEVVVDLSALPEADSSALAVLFAWQREQKEKGGSLRVTGAPEELLALAELYGVTGLLAWS